MRFVLFLLLAFLGCLGCSVDAQQRVVGVWVPAKDETKLPPIPIPGMEKRVESVMSRFVLKLRSDQTFVIASGAAVEGKWVMNGDRITLTPNKGQIPGPLGEIMPPVEKMEIKIQPDYNRLLLEQPTPLGIVTLVLRKSA